jgi:hypothetical protein
LLLCAKHLLSEAKGRGAGLIEFRTGAVVSVIIPARNLSTNVHSENWGRFDPRPSTRQSSVGARCCVAIRPKRDRPINRRRKRRMSGRGSSAREDS